MDAEAHRLTTGIDTREKKKRRASDLRCGLYSVAGFLVVGLVLGYLIVYHQHRKVILESFSGPWSHGGGVWRTGGRFHHFFKGTPHFVTVVMPSVVNPKGRTKRLESITDTWGPLSRAIYVVHNVSEYPSAGNAVYSEVSVPEDRYTYPQLMLVPLDIGPDEGVPRLNYVIREIFDKVDPDFAFFVNDHTFVIPEHVCHYLSRRQPYEDLYAGHALKNNKDVFNSGAAGYILSRQTMSRLIQAWEEEDPTCLLKGGANKWLQGNPGLVTAQCLKNVLHVSAEDTRHRGKWHRFHAFPLTRVVEGSVDEWYVNKHKNLKDIAGFDDSYGQVLNGTDCCSSKSMSFHYVDHLESRALFRVREALVKNPHLTDHELKALMIRDWPKGFKNLGGYSQPLPPEKNHEGWKAMLGVVRRISSRKNQMDC